MSKKFPCKKVNVYLLFDGQTEEVFNFYKQVFQVEYDEDGLTRYADMPNKETESKLSPEQANMVMHVGLPLSENFTLMGADIAPDTGMQLHGGNTQHISLEPSSMEETERIYAELSVKGEILNPLEKSFWGSYWAHFRDRYGVYWMLNFPITDTES